jgi:hypothetical protein
MNKLLLITTSIHEIELEVIPPQIESHNAFDEKQKFVSGPRHEFSIKVVQK